MMLSVIPRTYYLKQQGFSCTALSSWRNFSKIQTTSDDVKKQSIQKLLIANRGEIACRVMKTAKK